MSSESTPIPDEAREQLLRQALDRAIEQTVVERSDSGSQPVRLVIALSGGADSTALLHLVSRYVGKRFKILALHADHGLHPQSGHWADHCRQLCRRLGMRIEIKTVVVSATGNLEAAARSARYAFFAQHLNSDDLLLFGHHLQDQAETLLLRVLQGRGVVGMRSSGSLGQGYFVRPFLSLSKDHLVQYLKSVGEGWIEDPSNSQTRFDRNYLRHEVMPILNQRWPNSVQALGRISAEAGAQGALLQRFAAELPDCVSWVNVPAAKDQARVWLRAFLASRGEHRVTDGAIDEFFRQQRASGRALMALESGDSQAPRRLYAWRNDLYYERSDHEISQVWPQAGSPLPWHANWRQQVLQVDVSQGQSVDAIGYRGQLSLGCRDQFLTTDNGLAQRLKKLFQQGQIPPWRRAGYPLVCDEQGLVCMPGIWRRDTSVLDGDLTGYCTIRWLPSDSDEDSDAVF